MSSPKETVKLADEIRQRQAADLHFPTFATRGFGRRERPALRTDSLRQTEASDDASGSGPGDEDREDDAGAKVAAAAADTDVQPVLLPDDDDEEAGQLEMDYAPGETDNKKQEQDAADKPSGAEGEGLSLAAEILAAAASSGPTSPRKRTHKRRPDSLRRTESSSSAGRTSLSSLDSLPTSPGPRRKRPSLPRGESSRDSQYEAASKKRMTVLLEGEMPEGDQDLAASDDARSVSGEAEAQSVTGKEDGYAKTRARRTSDAMSESSLPRDHAKETGQEGSAPESDEGEEYDQELQSESDSGEDEESSDEDGEDDVEPSLKYSRVKGGVSDVLKRDTASAFALSSRFMALGTHAGMIYILDIDGNLVKGFRLHTASILDLVIDNTSDFVAAASMDGLVSISALATAEQYVFDFKRPMRCISLEPNFGRKSSRAFVCGGMAGALTHREKSWFGHKESVLHSGEGPIWTTRWRGNMIAWASDRGVRVYDTDAKQRISFISAPSKDVRGDLHRCTLYWQDDRTLLIAWADHIKVAKIKEKQSGGAIASSGASIASNSTTNAASALSKVGVPGAGAAHPQYLVEITAIFQLDCMISGIAPYGLDYLVLAYVTEDPEESDDDDDDEQDNGSVHRAFKRREALRPELRIISRAGEELSSDVLSLNDYSRFQCNDYLLVPSVEAHAYSAALLAGRKVRAESTEASQFYVVSPRDIVVSKPRDEKDHVEWLLERQRFQEALVKVEAMGRTAALANGFDAEEIGKKYLNWLFEEDRYSEAARVASKILGRNVSAWEDWIFLFVEKGKLGLAIPFIPTSDPTLSEMIYDMILAHFLQHDLDKLLETIQEWPPEIYSTPAVVLAIEDRLKSGEGKKGEDKRLLMECLAEIFIRNRQPGKALQYYLRLRRSNVFDLIRENNLFTAVQDQALLLIEFEEDLKTRRTKETSKHGAAIELLVDHTYSIPIGRVISQLESHPRYLYMYLDALFDRDPQQVTPFCDVQVKLYAEYESTRLMPYLRAMSSFYSFEKAYAICEEHDYVPEMVFLLGRVGDNKRALSLIIERLGDVERAIDFAKEQNDDDLWEDLLGYSESRPAFIRGLLENVGAEIDPIRLIRRIKNGLEIPGLKAALIKILSDFTLQISLLEGCEAILSHDTKVLSDELQRSQLYASYVDDESVCSSCDLALFAAKPTAAGGAGGGGAEDTYSKARQSKVVVYLCGHVHHLKCLLPPANVPVVKSTAGLVSGEVNCTTTQAFAGTPSIRQRWNRIEHRQSSSDTNGEGEAQKTIGGGGGVSRTTAASLVEMSTYGPLQRAQDGVAQFQARLKYEARLRSTLVGKKGCPTCRKDGLSMQTGGGGGVSA
ncbi:related to Vacuolar assembly protein VPS41 [Ustilago trichophora]|uniref:Related to Vacuolar assembly protein VPS41 n=1 Tax=Ustilago trichophora TaxID=86804 RepID=A0A5C3DVF7_9BASI|nr:related to Vacuolar assembly protein VPS41 [Ustilago trichophora]